MSTNADSAHAPDQQDVVQELGWGRLVFGNTFANPESLRDVLRAEETGRRDIGLYLNAPHVFVAQHPQEYFIDPSFTYRMNLAKYRSGDLPTPRDPVGGVTIRPVASLDELAEINRIYIRCAMVPADTAVMWDNHETDKVLYLIAVDDDSGDILGTVTGVDHVTIYGDQDGSCSLWCLAVDPISPRPGLGDMLVRALLDCFADRGRAFLDLSVMHDNEPAIKLYEQIGFERVPVLGIKRKNAINEPLFTGTDIANDLDELNPYARIIADEAVRRGINVEVLDAETGYIRLTYGAVSVVTRESLSELTSAVAMSRCADKRIAHRVVAEAGVKVPESRRATFDLDDHAFLEKHGAVVVKPVIGEQGEGITVGVKDHSALDLALRHAGGVGSDTQIEKYHEGLDLRIVVINGAVIAAAIRRPASVVGTGHHTIRQLIAAQSRRRAAATGGESRIPRDRITEDTVQDAGWSMDDVLPQNEELVVRRTANLHTGGTIHDVTDALHPTLGEVAVKAAEALDIPVTGIDLLVNSPEEPEYVFIEANERPGLANHEPRPTAQAFIDFLFPRSTPTAWAWEPDAFEPPPTTITDPGHTV